MRIIKLIMNEVEDLCDIIRLQTIELILEMKQIKWELDRERTFANRTRRYDKHMKKTSKRKGKLTRREKRRQMNPDNQTKKKKRVHFS